MSQAKPRAKSWTEIMSLDAMMLGYNHSQETEIKTPGKMRKNGNYIQGLFTKRPSKHVNVVWLQYNFLIMVYGGLQNYFHARLSFRGNGLEKFR